MFFFKFSFYIFPTQRFFQKNDAHLVYSIDYLDRIHSNKLFRICKLMLFENEYMYI